MKRTVAEFTNTIDPDETAHKAVSSASTAFAI